MYMWVYMYIWIYMCVCVCVCVQMYLSKTLKIYTQNYGLWWSPTEGRKDRYSLLQTSLVVQRLKPPKLPISIHMYTCIHINFLGFWWLSGKESTHQCRRHRRCGFYPWVGKILWRREWPPNPIFFTGEFHGQRNLSGYSQPMGLWSFRHDWVTATHTHLEFH